MLKLPLIGYHPEGDRQMANFILNCVESRWTTGRRC